MWVTSISDKYDFHLMLGRYMNYCFLFARNVFIESNLVLPSQLVDYNYYIITDVVIPSSVGSRWNKHIRVLLWYTEKFLSENILKQ